MLIKRLFPYVLTAAIFAVIAAAIFFADQRAERHFNSIGATMSSIALKAMARGYECQQAGRTLQDCQDEQQRIWKKVENGATADQILPFGKN